MSRMARTKQIAKRIIEGKISKKVLIVKVVRKKLVKK